MLHAAQRFSIENARIIGNQGQLFIIEPPQIQDHETTLNVNLENALFQDNTAGLALIYASHYTNMSISNSTFLDNFSTGRGSIVYSENTNSNVQIRNSAFDGNYAYLGGVFFSQLNGLVGCTNCTITNNFAVYGGVLYSQNEGQGLFKNCNFSHNNALEASVVYSINSDSQIYVL